MLDSEQRSAPESEASAAQPEQEHDRLAQAVDAEERPRLAFPVVGIGGSAGGLEAFIEFFDAMPADSGMAFVLIQHLAPDRESLIAEILSKHSDMPVHQVTSGLAVEPNHVYVIRPGHTLTINHGHLHLGKALREPANNHPVDDFFRSLAEEQRERSIAIIMSGMGSNGTTGVESIKAVGGMAVAQEPESAKFPSMPQHLLDSGNADFVLRPAEMPDMLRRYVAHPYVQGPLPVEPTQVNELQALGDILTVLRARTRRDFSGYKKPTVLRRIQRRMGLNQIEELGAYAQFLRHNTAEVPALCDDLMIHVTGFFRDPEAWEALQDRVIRPLIDQRENDSEVRCWVTACSTGEEAYTLSMLLWEAAEASGKTLDIKVFATDTADRTLAKARAGAYPAAIEAEITPERLQRFFERDDSMYRVKKELRELVVFAPQDVVQDPPFSRLDICTCRNLLIYLEPELQWRVLNLLHFGLREGGVLYLGASETVGAASELFETIDKRARIFRRAGPTRYGGAQFNYPRVAHHAPPAGPAVRTPPRLSAAQLSERTLLERYTPAAVTIDRDGRIIHFHGDTTPFLAQPTGEPTRDLMQMARDHVRGSIRIALQEAMAENRVAHHRNGFLDTDEGRFRIHISVG
ncbi:MAG: hypothetical protein H0T51_02030 [Pirellulales bacterium]|nr:hypothetical protein [Pirellulales bacterium]